MIVCVGLGVILHAYISLIKTRSRLHRAAEKINNEQLENRPYNGNLKRIQELTERLERSESIYERKDALLNSLLDAHGSAVIACSPAHEILHFNRVAEKALEYNASDITGKNFFEVFYGDSNSPEQKKFWEIATADSAIPHTTTIKTSSGVPKTFSWVARAFYGDENQLLYIFKIGRELAPSTELTYNTGDTDGTTERKRKRVGRVQKNGSQRARKSGSRSRRHS
jgi:PAS domain S-box-containing protein